MTWEADPMAVGDAASPLSVRDVVERHGGEFWFQRERTRHESYFCFLLPLAPARACWADFFTTSRKRATSTTDASDPRSVLLVAR